MNFAAIVLAGDRGPQDPVALATGAPCKALSPVGGVPLLWRVIGTLQQLRGLDRILLVGPSAHILAANPELNDALVAADITWIEPAASPSASAARALAQLPSGCPALLTTADHALLDQSMIEQFLDAAIGHDVSVAMVAYERVHRAYPESHRTTIKLGREGGYCGCNLFAVHSDAGRQLIADWQRVEAQRKHPARMLASLLGWTTVARYALGRLDLQEAFARLSARTGLTVQPVLLSQAEAAVDVDSVADLRLVESILARRSGSAGRD